MHHMLIEEEGCLESSAYSWAAGLFEGEGCATVLHPRGRKPHGYLCLNMTDQDVVEEFARVLARGRIYMQPLPPNKTRWTWGTAKRVDIEWFAEHIAPHLFPRRQRQVAAALAASREAARRYTHSLIVEMYGEGRTKVSLSPTELTRYRTEAHRRWLKKNPGYTCPSRRTSE